MLCCSGFLRGQNAITDPVTKHRLEEKRKKCLEHQVGIQGLDSLMSYPWLSARQGDLWFISTGDTYQSCTKPLLWCCCKPIAFQRPNKSYADFGLVYQFTIPGVGDWLSNGTHTWNLLFFFFLLRTLFNLSPSENRIFLDDQVHTMAAADALVPSITRSSGSMVLIM